MSATTVPVIARRVPVWSVLVGAPLAALVVWGIASLADVSLVAGNPPATVGPVSVVVVSVVVALAAWGVRAVFFRRHRTGWFVTCGVVLLVSLLGPLGAATAAATFFLALMHLAVAAVVIPGLAPPAARAA